MTTETPIPDDLLGVTLHFLVSGVTYHCKMYGQHISKVSRRGDTLLVNEDVLEASRDRFGNLPPLFTLAADPDAQLKKFGQQLVGIGPWPDLPKVTPADGIDFIDARETARQEAWAIENEYDRKAALDAVEERFGPNITSRTTARYGV